MEVKAVSEEAAKAKCIHGRESTAIQKKEWDIGEGANDSNAEAGQDHGKQHDEQMACRYEQYNPGPQQIKLLFNSHRPER